MADTAKIKSLRDATGLSFNEIKKALDEAGGDESRALETLNKLGAAAAAKKSSREVHEGIIGSYVHSNNKVGAMLELLCETDFVARNEEFKNLARDLAMQLAAMKPGTAEEFVSQPFIKDGERTVQDVVAAAIAKLGENIQIGKFVVFAL